MCLVLFRAEPGADIDAFYNRAMGTVLLAVASAVVGVTYIRVVLAERAQRREGIVDSLPGADAIVVFGGKCYERGPGIEVSDRLNHAAALYDRAVAPQVLLSGGVDAGVDEVEIMRRYVVKRGVPLSATGAARPGDNTRLTISCLDPGKTYVAVSSAYHAHRIASEARRQHKDVIVNCAPDSIELRNRRVLRVRRISEVAGAMMYASPPAIANPVRHAIGRLRHTVPGLLTPGG
jgi:vancomycin permeability regulator SanA